MLLHARLTHDIILRSRFADSLDESRRRQAVQGLAPLEVAKSRQIDERGDIAPPIDERSELLLRRGEMGLTRRQAAGIELEDEVEARHLLLDEAPLVDATRAFEQQRLRIDRDEDVVIVGAHVRLEAERPLRPGEEIIDRLLDLHADESVQLLSAEDVLLDENFAQALVALLRRLRIDRSIELALRDDVVFHERVAEPVTPVHDRGVGDAATVEIDVAEIVAVRDAETAGLLSHRQQLQHVRQTRLAEAPLDRHLSKLLDGPARHVGPIPQNLLLIKEEGIGLTTIRLPGQRRCRRATLELLPRARRVEWDAHHRRRLEQAADRSLHFGHA